MGNGPASLAALTVRGAVLDVAPTVAVMVTATSLSTGVDATSMPLDKAPAGTVTVVGTVAPGTYVVA